MPLFSHSVFSKRRNFSLRISLNFRPIFSIDYGHTYFTRNPECYREHGCLQSQSMLDCPSSEHTACRYVYSDRRFPRNSYRTRASLGAVGGMSKLIFGAVFPLGLMLVVLCGADLFTGSCMTLATAQAKQKISFGQTVFTLATSWLGNFAGALFVAFFIAYLSGLIFESAGGTMPWAAAVVNLANAKCSLGFTEALLRGVGCNWLVCLAVFAAAASTETIGKIAALWFPTMAFVALGMEHCIANMFFIPLGILTGTDPRYIALVEAGKAAALKADFYSFAVGNLIPVTIGNIIGGSVLVGMLYLAANIKKA